MNPRFCPLIGLLCATMAFTSARADINLVTHSDSWRYRKGTNAPVANWKTAAEASLDGTWRTGNGGIGYSTDTASETNQCQVILTDMRNSYTTVYMRRTFQIGSDVDPNLHLQLSMDYDDGFIAWLDGNYLTSANVTGAPADPSNTAVASANHESSRGSDPLITDLGTIGSRLGVGPHVLAIMGLNRTSDSTDLIQVPDLSLVTFNPACHSGAITANTSWYASNSPVVVCGNITINSGATLTIEPGTTVQLGSAVDIT